MKVRVRVFGEVRNGRALAEYQELHDLELAAASLVDVAIDTLRGYEDTVEEHDDVVGEPTAFVLVAEPFDPHGPA